MAFSENREYQHGDEIRDIDWNVTARMGHPYVKIYEEERELTVVLMIDVSASQSFGSREQLKKNLITELTAVLAFSAIQNNDKIGVLFFSDRVEKFIPPKKGRSHILRIIRELLDFEPEGRGTDISCALDYFNGVVKKRCIGFVISDWLDDNYSKELRIANRKHDIVGIRVHDKLEGELPNVGLVQIEDPETGKVNWINTGSKKLRKKYALNAMKHDKETQLTLQRCGVDMVSIATDQNYVGPLMKLFKMRGA
jgi:uncharacterized protein (DUF58 family)